MNRNIAELFVAGVFGISAIAGFAATQTRQAYDLTQIEFCPVSKTEKGQLYLDRLYCNHPRYVLTESWRRYGGYDSVIPYKGDAIQWVRDLPTDNPSQLTSNAVAVIGLWGVAGCFIVRSQRLKRKDYELGEAEKTDGYATWQAQAHRREVKQHSTHLNTERLKDGLTTLDMEERKTLGLTDEENENASSQIQFEDFIKARAVNHSAQDKTIAENLLAKAKADKERAKTEGKAKDMIADNDDNQSIDRRRANDLIQALKDHENGWLWKVIDNQTPLWLIGRQGSSKTWTAATFALIRKYCLEIPVRHLIDEHADGVNSQIWQYLDPHQTTSHIDGMGEVFDAITESWRLRIAGKDELEQPTTIMPEQIVVDEYTELKSEVGEPAEKFYRRHLKDTRKAMSYVIGVTHNDTNSSYPEGTQAQRESGTILIQKFSANGKTPLPRVKVVRGLLDEQGNELLEFEATIPQWFRPDTIYNHFNHTKINF